MNFLRTWRTGRNSELWRFSFYILKLNVIAAVVILLVKVLATLFKGRVSARWKYLIWLLITINLCVPVRLPANLALVDFKVLRSSQQNTQSPKITDYAVRPEESQKITENVSSASKDMKNLTEIPEQRELSGTNQINGWELWL